MSEDTVVINYTISTLKSALEVRFRTTNSFQSEAVEDTSARAYVARGGVRAHWDRPPDRLVAVGEDDVRIVGSHCICTVERLA